ncbi:hypothetical protein ACJVC5_06970 [Peredibacter sp. HCB2-198]|uniref:hypothetical protein n=1 Tax=Peredibacter sp. HCB2-198 TaxID=3383025 RepID=UPI0038B487A7
MKFFLFALITFFLCSCGKKGHETSGVKSDEILTVDLEKEIRDLANKGLHFSRLSNLQDPKRPMTLYCSNTTSLNSEKIDRLMTFSQLLQSEKQETYFINKWEISKVVLLQLIQEAKETLEEDPYASVCPQIYLAIQNPY